MSRKTFFITGTDTNIGKTILSFLFMSYFFNCGKNPEYLKPFQTGCKTPDDKESDARFVYKNVRELSGLNPGDSVIYCLKNPKAPLFAAKDDQITLDLETVLQTIEKKEQENAPLIIEGAGGLFVPIDSKTLMIDFIKKTNSKVVLAARAGLGTINHTLLSLEALKSRGILSPGIVLINPEDQSVADDMLQENIEAIETFSGLNVSGVINHINDFSTAEETYSGVIENLLSIS